MRRLSTKAIALLYLFLPSLFAGDGLERAMRRVEWSDPLGGKLAVADFDRDQKADAAVLLRPHLPQPLDSYRIEVNISGRPSVAFTFQSPGGAVAVSARDIDDDHDSDLVVEERFTAQGVKVWINDGKGGFHEGRLEDYPGLDNDDPIQLRAPQGVSKSPAGIRTTRSDSPVAASSRAAVLPPDGRDFSRGQSGRNRRPDDVPTSGPSRAPPAHSIL